MQVLSVNDNLPVRSDLPVHSGKVRSVYWLTAADSQRLIRERGYPVPADTPLAVMIISDRISAFDCIWQGEGGLQGVPGKGAALNTIANHWFAQFKQHGLADSHILETPHPLVWIVQKARPIKIEAICRSYITGSMWRAYQKGERTFCGIALPEGLTRDSKLATPIITPSTKGVLTGLQGVPEADDVNVSRHDLERHFAAFGFNQLTDIDLYEKYLLQGFAIIQQQLANLDQIFVDTKFEFGFVKDENGQDKMIYMDEVGTPDSSRIWDGESYRQGKVLEKSKEGFRQALLSYFPEPDILLNKNRMPERQALAEQNALPGEMFEALSATYCSLARTISGQEVLVSDDPRAEILQVLSEQFALTL